MVEWIFERLGRHHKRDGFTCGHESLDEFIRSLVSQYEKRHLGRTYVAVRPSDDRVYGYYTLAAGSIAHSDLPPEKAKKLPKHRLPVLHLGQLAVDLSVQGHGLGELLLLDALKQCLEISNRIGAHAVDVKAINESARRFYAKYGFSSFPADQFHLLLAVKTIPSILRK